MLFVVCCVLGVVLLVMTAVRGCLSLVDVCCVCNWLRLRDAYVRCLLSIGW